MNIHAVALLAMLAGAGVPILKALQAAAETLANRAMRNDALDALDQVREAVAVAADLILLDNMTPEEVREAIAALTVSRPTGKVAVCLAGGGIEGLLYEVGVLRAIDHSTPGRCQGAVAPPAAPLLPWRHRNSRRVRQRR